MHAFPVIHGGSNTEISSMLTNSMAAPQPQAVQAAVKLLKDMNCLTRAGELTVLGRAVATIPVQPNVAKFLLIAAAFRCIKPAACIAAFLSIKSPFQQSVNESQDKGKVTGKDYFNKGFASDHLTMIQAYVEWRRETLRGKGDDFCDEQGLSPETLDMAFMMVQQFVSFMVDAGYDGEDVTGEGDLGEVDPVKKGSDVDALLKAAMVAGFAPNVCVLYRGNRSPYWYLDSNEEVSPFRGSANADYQMSGADGEEWMVFSDSMKMGRFNSIMDSSLVFSPFVLLFANALMVDEKKNEIRFDKWYAYIQQGPWVKELLYLRSQVMPQFKDAMEARNISDFPRELVARMTDFLRIAKVTLSVTSVNMDSVHALFVHRTTERRKTKRNSDVAIASAQGSSQTSFHLYVSTSWEEPVRRFWAGEWRGPEDVPVPDDDSGDLDEPAAAKPAKTKLKAAEQPTRLSRGQRKRQQRKENFLRKFELANLIGKQEEAFRTGSLANLADLTAHLEEDKAPATAKGPKRLGRKAQAAQDEREMAQFQGVLGFKAFQADPFGALEQHLKNSIKLQKEKEKTAAGKQKAKLSQLKDAFRSKKRLGAVKNKFAKSKKPKK
ncbi:unnamed protein product [Symbiodinium sp. CCMP2592]|nr:unnamed protein product [Symbiodinium sp. CCMP2592]